MNILRIKRTAGELIGTGALLYAMSAILLRPAVAAAGVLYGLQLCCESVIPALFPFLVLSKLMLERRAAAVVGVILLPYTRLLGIRSRKAPAAMLCGILGGFASGAKAIDTLYCAGDLSQEDAELLLVCTIGSGPGFVVGSVGALMLGNPAAGWLLLAAQLGASLCCGLAAALYIRLRAGKAVWRQPARACRAGAAPATGARAPAGPAGFVSAVRDGVNAIITLCGYVTLFCFFTAIAVPAGADAGIRFLAALGLEVTNACRAASESGMALRTQLCCAALSVMGASVFLQVRALLARQVSLVPLAVSRAMHLPLALVLLQLLAGAFPFALTAGSSFDAPTLLAVRMPADVMLALFATAALACGIFPARNSLRGGKNAV